MPYTQPEQEAIGLCIAWEAIGDMANHALLKVMPSDDSHGEAEIRFRTREALQLFLVRLLDFVKEQGAASLLGTKGSCLEVLRAACGVRSFDVDGSVLPLERAVEAFESWLCTETPLRLWLPSLDTDARIRVSREDLLFISGNQSKHNLARLTGVSRRVVEILRRHGYSVPLEAVPLALDDFQQHLQEDYFLYYGTWITEHLVQLHWGLQNYLLPTFRQVYNAAPEGAYEYAYAFPPGVEDKIAREWFWRLMNHVRSGPHVQPFSVPQYLRKEPRRDDG